MREDRIMRAVVGCGDRGRGHTGAGDQAGYCRIRRRLLLAALSLAATAVSSAAPALGFGDLQLHSALAQPLSADIPLLAVKPGQRERIEVSMADNKTFERFGVERAPIVDDITLTVLPGSAKDELRVHLSTQRPVREPFIAFFLQATWSGQRLLRQYTLLLDPPGRAPDAQVPSVAPATAPGANAGAYRRGG